MEFIHETIDLGYEDLVATTTSKGRTYAVPDGGSYPSITTVLSLLNEEAIAAWRKRVGEDEANRIGHRASSRGTMVHSIIEKYLLNESTTDFLPHIRQSLENVRPILDKSIGKIFGLETPLYSRHLGLAGRVDCVAEFDGVPSIVDFKTSTKEREDSYNENYYIQTCAYSYMFEERTGQKAEQCVILVVTQDGTVQEFIKQRDDYIPLLNNAIEEWNKRS